MNFTFEPQRTRARVDSTHNKNVQNKERSIRDRFNRRGLSGLFTSIEFFVSPLRLYTTYDLVSGCSAATAGGSRRWIAPYQRYRPLCMWRESRRTRGIERKDVGWRKRGLCMEREKNRWFNELTRRAMCWRYWKMKKFVVFF